MHSIDIAKTDSHENTWIGRNSPVERLKRIGAISCHYRDTASIEGNISGLKEILGIAKPLIVIGKNRKYCRIHEESAPVVKSLIREYLQK